MAGLVPAIFVLSNADPTSSRRRPGESRDDDGVALRFNFQTATRSMVIVRLDRTIQYSRDIEVLAEQPRATGCPACAGHDNRGDMSSHPRGGIRPSFASSRPPSNAEGAGKAGWPLHPGLPRKEEFARAREPQVQAVTTGLPCAVAYGLYALSSVNHSVCHRRQRDANASSPTWRQPLGRQDHTTSPYAKAAARQSAPSRPPQPRLTFVTTAIRPSAREAGYGEDC